MRVAQELVLHGLQISSGGVRGVCQRQGLLTKHDRLLRLEKTTAERKLTLSEKQIRLLETLQPGVPRAPHRSTAYLTMIAVEHLLRWLLKGVGKVYLQTAIDYHSRYAWARLYPTSRR